MDSYEVTGNAYEACIRAGLCSGEHLGDSSPDGVEFNPTATCNHGVGDHGNHPINCVDWGQAGTYCEAQGKRLPTEEEWEWAARGEANGSTYPWGGAEPEFQLCWSGVTQLAGTCPVGSHPSGDTRDGIHDLAGNVSEWTASRSAAGGALRVLRGGAWNSKDAARETAGFRYAYTPAHRSSALGFRCAR